MIVWAEDAVNAAMQKMIECATNGAASKDVVLEALRAAVNAQMVYDERTLSRFTYHSPPKASIDDLSEESRYYAGVKTQEEFDLHLKRIMYNFPEIDDLEKIPLIS